MCSIDIVNVIVLYTIDPHTFCDACTLTKSTRKPFQKDIDYGAVNIMDMFHTDIKGPFEQKSYDGFKYYQPYVDCASGRIFVVLLKSRKEAFDKFVKLKRLLETETDLKLKSLMSDKATEFHTSKKMREFAENEGLKLR